MKLLEEQQSLAQICSLMTSNGIRIDPLVLATNTAKLQSDKFEIANGFSININSPKQLIAYFKEKHGITLPDTSKATFEKYSENYPLITELQDIFEYKNFGKGMNAWYDPKYIDANNYLHPRWNPTGTVERRLSCSGPNFQNVPHRNGNFSQLVRSPVIPEPHYILYEIDAVSGEDWSCAFAAKDERLLDELATGVDFHSRTAAYIFNKPINKKDHKSERDTGKITNHAHKYLIGFKYVKKGSSDVRKFKAQVDDGLAILGWEGKDYYAFFTGWRMAQIAFGTPTKENQRKILSVKAKLIQDYKGIAKWQQETFESWQKTRYVINPFGFGRPLFGDEEECAKRAVAFIGASTLQSVVIRGTIDLWTGGFLRHRGRSILHAQIHDSLLFSLNTASEYDAIAETITYTMQQPRECLDGRKLSVPWTGKSGTDWSKL